MISLVPREKFPPRTQCSGHQGARRHIPSSSSPLPPDGKHSSLHSFANRSVWPQARACGHQRPGPCSQTSLGLNLCQVLSDGGTRRNLLSLSASFPCLQSEGSEFQQTRVWNSNKCLIYSRCSINGNYNWSVSYLPEQSFTIWHCWRFRGDHCFGGTEGLARALWNASHPWPPPHPKSGSNQKCLWTWPKIPWWLNRPQSKTTGLESPGEASVLVTSFQDSTGR